MNTLLIFVWIWAALIAMSFWESSVEGRNAWAKSMAGWKIKITKNNTLTRYHLWILIMSEMLIDVCISEHPKNKGIYKTHHL